MNLNDFDHYIKCKLKCRYYGRYVDDFVIVHNDRHFLKGSIPKISAYLQKNLQPDLHPNKIYLQPAQNGVQFLGATIKPYRIYPVGCFLSNGVNMKNRSISNFKNKLDNFNTEIRSTKKLDEQQKSKFISSMNSCLGLFRHFNIHKLRKKMLNSEMSAYFLNYVYISGGYKKLVSKIKTANSIFS